MVEQAADSGRGSDQVNLTINGKSISAPSSLSVIQALWHTGYPRVKSVGCLEGVCGSCRVMVRRADSREVTTDWVVRCLSKRGCRSIFCFSRRRPTTVISSKRSTAPGKYRENSTSSFPRRKSAGTAAAAPQPVQKVSVLNTVWNLPARDVLRRQAHCLLSVCCAISAKRHVLSRSLQIMSVSSPGGSLPISIFGRQT